MDREVRKLLRESQQLISKSRDLQKRTRELIEISRELSGQSLQIRHNWKTSALSSESKTKPS